MNPIKPEFAEAPPTFFNKGPLRILLVEDYVIDARLLIELLALVAPADRPFVTHVHSVGEAIEKLAAHPSYDCVLLDLGLPDGDGVQNVERVRAASRNVAIVVMTGLDDQKRAAEALRLGAQEYLVKGHLDHQTLMRHLRHAVERNDLVADLDQKNEQQKLLAGHDALTGLVNRQLLADRAREAIAQAERRNERLALSFVDLDGFKAINDRLGHDAGDMALIEVAKALQASVRSCDTVARVGGDEFVVLQIPAGDETEIREAGSRMVRAVGDIRAIEEQAIRIGASVGIAIYPDHGDSLQALLLHADESMYGVKRAGGGGLRIKSSSREPAPSQFGAATDPAPGSEIASLVYQPWMSGIGEHTGVEALLRQRRGPDWVAPEQLLQAAELLGSLSGLSQWVLRTACGQWSRWQRAGSTLGRLSVNMTALEVGNAGFPDQVSAALRLDGPPADCLQIEIAEHLLDAPTDQLLDNMRLLRRRGVRIMLDCFGRDSGSLKKLVSLPIDGVKLDRSVVSGLSADCNEQWALMAGVVHTARIRGIEVVAVGVEHEAQARGCLTLDCTSLQGSWLAAPTAPDDMLALLGKGASRARLRALRGATAGQKPTY